MHTLFAAKQADGLGPARAALQAAEPATPDIWHPMATLAVGGLIAVGFNRDCDEMMIVSANGQSIVDCRSGDLLYRNKDDNGYEIALLKAARLDHPAAERFDMAGMHGGGLKTVTRDGWTVDQISLCWPETFCILQPPEASIYFLRPQPAEHAKDGTFHLLAKEHQSVHAFGFSWTGQSLVLATSSDIRIWSRAPLALTNPA